MVTGSKQNFTSFKPTDRKSRPQALPSFSRTSTLLTLPKHLLPGSPCLFEFTLLSPSIFKFPTLQMLAQSHLSSNSTFLSLSSNPSLCLLRRFQTLQLPSSIPRSTRAHSPRFNLKMIANSKFSNHFEALDSILEQSKLDRFAEVGNKLADAAGDVILKYYRKSFGIMDKEDLSPVTIADQAAEEAMVSIIQENFPCHAIYGEEKGWRCKEEVAEYVWVLDPIDGTKSFITGKPLFGTLIALLYRGKPVKVPLYGCDCYAYALLASGFVDLVVESGLKPYDFLSLIPVIEGAGGVITDWKGHQLKWEASSNAHAISFNVLAAGDEQVHQQAVDALQWQ